MKIRKIHILICEINQNRRDEARKRDEGKSVSMEMRCPLALLGSFHHEERPFRFPIPDYLLDS